MNKQKESLEEVSETLKNHPEAYEQLLHRINVQELEKRPTFKTSAVRKETRNTWVLILMGFCMLVVIVPIVIAIIMAIQFFKLKYFTV